MYQMSTFEIGGVIKSVNKATQNVNWFPIELFHDFNSNGIA